MSDPVKEHGRGWIGGQRDVLARLSERFSGLSPRATVEDAMRELGQLRAEVEGEAPATAREDARRPPERVSAPTAALFADEAAP